MISKTIGFRGLAYFQANPYVIKVVIIVYMYMIIHVVVVVVIIIIIQQKVAQTSTPSSWEWCDDPRPRWGNNRNNKRLSFWVISIFYPLICRVYCSPRFFFESMTLSHHGNLWAPMGGFGVNHHQPNRGLVGPLWWGNCPPVNQHRCGKSPFSTAKSFVNGPFSSIFHI